MRACLNADAVEFDDHLLEAAVALEVESEQPRDLINGIQRVALGRHYFRPLSMAF